MIALISVDFPQPDSPMMPTISPLSTVRPTLRKALQHAAPGAEGDG